MSIAHSLLLLIYVYVCTNLLPVCLNQNQGPRLRGDEDARNDARCEKKYLYVN